jgi:hypothetical protein
MIIHNLDTTMMRKYLPVLEARCIEGEAEWFPYATMLDKYRMSQGLPQWYGMQYKAIDEEHTKFKLHELDNLDAVNERRRKIGMGPIVNPDEVITVTYD